MKCVLVGSRYFGATVLDALRREEGVEFTLRDRARGGRPSGRSPRRRPAAGARAGEPEGRARRGDPRGHRSDRRRPHARARQQRGAGAVAPRRRSATTRRCCRAIAASPRSSGPSSKATRSPAARSITSPTAGMPAPSPRRTGASSPAARSARELWERALAPMGLALLGRVVRHARDHASVPAQTQDLRFATRAPMIRRSVVLTEDAPRDDHVAGRHGDRARTGPASSACCPIGPSASARTGRRAACRAWPASSPAWCTSRCRARTPRRSPSPCKRLESSGLRVVIAKSDSSQAPAGLRGIDLELVGDDRVGIVSNLTRILAEARHQHRAHPHRDRRHDADRAQAPSSSWRTCWCRTRCRPTSCAVDSSALASEMKVDIALGDRAD